VRGLRRAELEDFSARAEVGNLDRGRQRSGIKVCRLDVAVDDVARWCAKSSAEQTCSISFMTRATETIGARRASFAGCALHQFHRYIEGAFFLARIEDHGDIRMVSSPAARASVWKRLISSSRDIPVPASVKCSVLTATSRPSPDRAPIHHTHGAATQLFAKFVTSCLG